MSRRPTIFAVRLHAASGATGIRALRGLLKTLLRQYGMRCIAAHEEHPPDLFGESPLTLFRHRLASGVGRSNTRAIRNRQMDMRKYAGENYLKVANVEDGPIQAQIAVIKEGKFDKPNLVFESGSILGLNATNTRILVKAYGAASDGWIGKEIELFLGEVEFQGQNKPAVLVRPISPPTVKPKKSPEKPTLPAPDDEIPF